MPSSQPDLTATLGPLAPFAGRWRGSGEGHYPTITDFTYSEEIELEPSGKPFLHYRSRTRASKDGRPLHTETGYLRFTGSNHVEFLIAQPTGFVEIQRATPDNGVLYFDEFALGVSPDAKNVRSVRRRFALDGDLLRYDMWMSFADVPMTHHLRAELHRVG